MLENLKGILLLLACKVIGADKQRGDDVDIHKEEPENNLSRFFQVETPVCLSNMPKNKDNSCGSHNTD